MTSSAGRERVDPVGVAAELGDGLAHRGEVDDAGHAGEVLHDTAGRGELDLGVRLGGRVPAGQCLDLVAGDVRAVLGAQQVLEQHLQAERAALRALHRVQPGNLVGGAADLEGPAGPEAVRSHGPDEFLPSQARAAASWSLSVLRVVALVALRAPVPPVPTCVRCPWAPEPTAPESRVRAGRGQKASVFGVLRRGASAVIRRWAGSPRSGRPRRPRVASATTGRTPRLWSAPRRRLLSCDRRTACRSVPATIRLVPSRRFGLGQVLGDVRAERVLQFAVAALQGLDDRRGHAPAEETAQQLCGRGETGAGCQAPRRWRESGAAWRDPLGGGRRGEHRDAEADRRRDPCHHRDVGDRHPRRGAVRPARCSTLWDAASRFAEYVPEPARPWTPMNVATASWALLTLSTRSAPVIASASLPAMVTPTGAGTFGSKPRTTARPPPGHGRSAHRPCQSRAAITRLTACPESPPKPTRLSSPAASGVAEGPSDPSMYFADQPSLPFSSWSKWASRLAGRPRPGPVQLLEPVERGVGRSSGRVVIESEFVGRFHRSRDDPSPMRVTRRLAVRSTSGSTGRKRRAGQGGRGRRHCLLGLGVPGLGLLRLDGPALTAPPQLLPANGWGSAAVTPRVSPGWAGLRKPPTGRSSWDQPGTGGPYAESLGP